MHCFPFFAISFPFFTANEWKTACWWKMCPKLTTKCLIPKKKNDLDTMQDGWNENGGHVTYLTFQRRHVY